VVVHELGARHREDHAADELVAGGRDALEREVLGLGEERRLARRVHG